MQNFYYKAKEGPNKVVDGVVQAESVDNAVRKIIALGLTPVDVSQSKVASKRLEHKFHKPSLNFFKRVRLLDQAMFTRQLCDMVEASVPILKSLQVIANQTTQPVLKEILNKMYLYVKDGGSLSGALALYPKTFSTLYINMVKAGEVSGQLPVILKRLADYLEKMHDVRNKVRASLIYPSIILVVGALTIFVMLTFVIPRITIIFDDLGQDLPLMTVLLKNISQFFARFWWFIVLGVILLVGYLKQVLGTPQGRKRFDRLLLKIPLVGNYIKIVEIANFARTLGTLVESRVPITTALNSVWATVDNTVLQEQIKNLSQDVADGMSLKAGIRQCRFFPEMVVNMVSVGEETGNLDRSLFKIAEAYERQSEHMMRTMISLLEPITLIFIVVIVLFIVMAMLLPIFQMNLLFE